MKTPEQIENELYFGYTEDSEHWALLLAGILSSAVVFILLLLILSVLTYFYYRHV